MNLISILIIVLSILYILYIVCETITLKALRKRFKFIIHVNGIRGKSTIVRLLDAGLRECGFKVFSKTTGTIPTYISLDNKQTIIKRIGQANIREQIHYMIKALKDGADTLVFECMAVNKEYQRICEEKILKADIAVITNVRKDHIGEMGDSLDELAEAMSLTIPRNGIVVTGSSEYFDYFTDKAILKNTKCYLKSEYKGDTLNTFKENIEIALKVCECMNLNKDTFINGMKKYQEDFGALKEYKLNNTIFINGLSINDTDSTRIVYNDLIKKYNKDDITILLNSRTDRPTRLIQHINLIKDIKPNRIYLVGSNTFYIKYRLLKFMNKENVIVLKKYSDLLSEFIVFGIGNIKNDGIKLINYFKEGGSK